MTSDSTNELRSDSRSDAKSLYRTIWRWHFYAGIFCIPFVIILAITGSIYLFKPYYEHWQESDYRGLVVSGDRQLPNDQIAAALASVEGAMLLNYRLPLADDEAVRITVRADHSWHVYVNPYTLEVLDTLRRDQGLMQWVRTFHGELLLGDVGSILVELAACWSIVLIVTGLYLWWPRNAKGLAGVLYPRLRQSSRIFWRDLHAVVGIWISAFALFLLVSGLPWALVWGASLKEVRSFSAASVVNQNVQQNLQQKLQQNVQQNVQHDGHHAEHAEQHEGHHPEHHAGHHAKHQSGQQAAQQDWTQNRQEEDMHSRAQASAIFNLTPAILTTAMGLNPAPPVELSVADARTGQWKLSSQTPNRPQRVDAWINAEGVVERRSDFASKKTLDRVIGVGIAAHEGYLFGWFNLVLGVLTCVGLVLMSVSGFILWRKRKPQSMLGAPVPRPTRVGAVVVAITFGLALFLPLMAISLIVILLLEFVLLRRILAVKQWLGLAV